MVAGVVKFPEHLNHGVLHQLRVGTGQRVQGHGTLLVAAADRQETSAALLRGFGEDAVYELTVGVKDGQPHPRSACLLHQGRQQRRLAGARRPDQLGVEEQVVRTDAHVATHSRVRDGPTEPQPLPAVPVVDRDRPGRRVGDGDTAHLLRVPGGGHHRQALCRTERQRPVLEGLRLPRPRPGVSDQRTHRQPASAPQQGGPEPRRQRPVVPDEQARRHGLPLICREDLRVGREGRVPQLVGGHLGGHLGGHVVDGGQV